ncbi:MAG: hypothetical protein H7Y04_04990, partial [Verrucomicrobia bacterium]|nr:hypothetical protein [Cytophagales bacterium]
MELENLKILWKDLATQPTQIVDRQDFMQMIRAKSNDITAKISRNLRAEIIFSVVLVIAYAVFGILTTDRNLGNFLLLTDLVSLPFFIYFIYKYKNLRFLQLSGDNLQISLQTTIKKLEAYISFCKKWTYILTPISFFVGGIFGAYKGGDDGFGKDPVKIAIIFGTLTVLGLLTLPLVKWYIEKLYGIHIKKLKDCLAELEHNLPEYLEK